MKTEKQIAALNDLKAHAACVERARDAIGMRLGWAQQNKLAQRGYRKAMRVFLKAALGEAPTTQELDDVLRVYPAQKFPQFEAKFNSIP